MDIYDAESAWHTLDVKYDSASYVEA
jgi:hypothetical protein